MPHAELAGAAGHGGDGVRGNREAAVWHILKPWRDDVEIAITCRSCGVMIRPGDAYRVAGIAILCTLRPFCPPPAERVIEPDPRRAPLWRTRRRVVVVNRPSWHRRHYVRRERVYRPRGSKFPTVTCRCGREFRQITNNGQPQQACSVGCERARRAERAAERRRRDCAVCAADFVYLSSHPSQETCSPSCGARLRERRKREARAA